MAREVSFGATGVEGNDMACGHADPLARAMPMLTLLVAVVINNVKPH
jgi:hypothetical protein